MGTSYETDIVAWANEQAALLREGRFAALDLEHLAEEIEDVGKSEQRELANRMAVLLMHLLKWQFQPDHRNTSWKATIKTQRNRIERRLEKTPSLKPSLLDAEWIADAWDDARDGAAKETNIEYTRFPEVCPWPMEQALKDDFYPDLSH
ncbi:MAG: DUF29 domain-containing protein [Azonexus sp.]|jgi:hypothetical protein|nr:DUF29 domain-containing protein [Azonexus sp.]